MLLVDHHSAARGVLWASFALGVVGEIVATRMRGGPIRASTGPSLDRGTKAVLVVAMVAGLFVGALVARDVPSLRAGANTWTTYSLGLAVLWFGMALRVWAVWSLGRYFRREVTIEPGQTVHESGPYRFVRHPAYAGDLLIVLGFGLAWGSWAGAAIGTAIAAAGHVPRIRVEEAELHRALGAPYEAYAAHRARLVPGIW
jgi:protein-S-isoprenylcysteine O-methyltransferase Ste14